MCAVDAVSFDNLVCALKEKEVTNSISTVCVDVLTDLYDVFSSPAWHSSAGDPHQP